VEVLFDPPHAMFQLAEQDAMPHDRRMVLREGLASGHLTVLQIIQLAAVFMQQNCVLVQNTGMLGQDTGVPIQNTRVLVQNKRMLVQDKRVLAHGLRDL
jgi:hypothetical protein